MKPACGSRWFERLSSAGWVPAGQCYCPAPSAASRA
jgi:hypothetical protein